MLTLFTTRFNGQYFEIIYEVKNFISLNVSNVKRKNYVYLDITKLCLLGHNKIGRQISFVT
jgi:hypothetical protein